MKAKNNLSGFFYAACALFMGSANVANAQLYFSEYAEGSGYNKCVEIYHCGDSDLDLSNWQFHSYQNGNTTAGYIINLSSIQATLASGEILVICNPGAAANATLTLANVDLFSNSIQFNGNDAIGLYNTVAGAYSDIFGDASSTSNFAKDQTWARSCDVVASQTFPGSNSTSNWTLGTKDDLSGFGTFAGCTSCPTVDEETGSCEFEGGDDACVTLTGYLEGDGYNKCVEITNPTCDTICLSNIEYRAYHNGATTPTYQRTLGDFKDFLAPGESYVICNPDADSLTLLVADTTWSGIQHNGNDAIELFNFAQNSSCDIFGNIGEDSLWIADCGGGDTNRTANTNLTRIASSSCIGVTSDPANGVGFPTLCSEWTQDTTLNDTSGLGYHDVSFCQSIIFGCGADKTDEEGVSRASATEMSVYPNPANTSATFEFSVSADQKASLSIYTLSGVMVAQPFNAEAEEGVVYRTNVAVNELSSGTYIYRLDAGADSKVGKFTVLK